MPAYDYKALDARGKQKQGVMEADAPRAVRQQLREKGMTPLAVAPATEKQARANPLSSRGSLAAADLALVTRQLSTLIQSGIPVEQALSAAAQQSTKPRIRSMLIAIRAKVMEGYSLADSLGEFPRAFPRLYRSTVAAGEHAGHLDLVLNRLADYTESRQEARQKIRDHQHALGQGGQLLPLLQEHFNNVRNHVGQQEHHDGDGHHAQDDGIDGRELDFLARFLAALGVVRQPVQHQVQMARVLAGRYG